MIDRIAFELRKLRDDMGEEVYEQECKDVMKTQFMANILTYRDMLGVTVREACFVAHHEMIEAIKQCMNDTEEA